MEEQTPIGADFSILEYAVERKILEAPILEFAYYTDVPGLVPQQPEPSGDGNDEPSPDWGFDIIVIGGSLRYGPWADRQR